ACRTHNSEVQKHFSVEVSAKPRKPCGCRQEVWDRDNRHRELCPILRSKERCKKTSNAKTADGRNCPGEHGSEEHPYGEHLFRRELIQVVNAKLFFESRYFVHVDIESVSAKRLTLNALELLTHSVIFVRRNDLVQLRKQYRILARLVRCVHAVKEFQVAGQAIAIILRLE